MFVFMWFRGQSVLPHRRLRFRRLGAWLHAACLPEVEDRPGLDVLLQRLERAATGLRHLREDEEQRDRTDDGEYEEHSGDTDSRDERREEQREDPVCGPPEEHRDADRQAA